MSSAKLTAPVGLSPRTSEGDDVKNKPEDVLLVRRMLEANKIGPLGSSKKMDAGLLKAIGAFQKKAGFKNPDKVVDPGGAPSPPCCLPTKSNWPKRQRPPSSR